MPSAESKFVPRLLFKGVTAVNAQGVDCSLEDARECTHHQLVVTCTPDPSTVTVSVRGIQHQSGLRPARFDSRLDAILLANGSQSFVFYGAFDGLRFDFSSVTGTPQVSAHLLSHVGELIISENTP